MNALRFEGSGFEYFKIWIVNILLTIVTLGLYYPWAKVRNRRYFCANSMLEDRNFEYHATGKQLFIGYLIAMAIFIAFVIVQNISPIGSLVVVGLFVLALPWIIWRSLKFNMRMTSFSNVRFGFDGILGGAYINYLILPILCFLALYAGPIGLAIFIPMMAGSLGGLTSIVTIIGVLGSLLLALFLFAFLKKRNTSYAINGYRYGQGVFSTNVETKAFLWITLKSIGLTILALLGLVVLIAVLASISGLAGKLLELQGSLQDPAALQSALGGGILVMIGLLYIGLIILSMLIFAYFYTRQRTYIYKSSNLDGQIKFASTLKAGQFAWVIVSNFLLIIVTLGLATPWVKVRLARLFLENTHVDTSVGFDTYVTQKQKEQSSLGEQIGDAFDVDVGVGF